MSTLCHSFAAYRRLMQMSRTDLFAFVEGYTNKFFFGEIMGSVSRREGVSFEVITGEELSGAGGGKQVLLSFFDYLKRKKSLIDTFKGKTTSCVFFLDKDLDDFMKIKRRSNHTIYTETYEAENYLFIYGDLCKAAAASGSLDMESIRVTLSDYNVWRRDTARRCKDWVKLCFYSRKHNIRSPCSYGHDNLEMNDRTTGRMNGSKYTAYLEGLEQQSGLSRTEFEESFRKCERIVDRIYRREQHDLIFKGKWYSYLLAKDISRIAAAKKYRSLHMEERLVTALEVTLNFNDNWTGHFRTQVCNVMTGAGFISS